MSKLSINQYLGIACAIITSILIGVFGYLKPFHNWDMIPYVAAAYQYDGLRNEKLLQATFAEVKAEVTPSEYMELTTGYYRQTLSENPVALEENINFYSVRPLYILMIRTINYYFGTSYLRATNIISCIFSTLAILTLFLIFNPLNYIEIALFPAVMVAVGFPSLARLSTPDAVASFMALLALWSLLRPSKLGYLIAVVLPYVRPDYIIFSVLLSIHTYIFVSKRWGVSVLIGALISYVAIAEMMNGYGWVKTFNFAFIDMTPFPNDAQVSHRVADYVKPYYVCLHEFIHGPLFIPLVASCLVTLSYNPVRIERVHIFGISTAFFTLHTMVWPIYETRYFIWCIGITYLVLIKEASTICGFVSKLSKRGEIRSGGARV